MKSSHVNISVIIAGLLLFPVNNVCAVDYTKSAKKEAQRLTKEGWMAEPGMPTISQQCVNSIQVELAYDEEGYPRYVSSSGMSQGTTFSEAYNRAYFMAVTSLIQTCSSEFVAKEEVHTKNELKLQSAPTNIHLTQNIKQTMNMELSVDQPNEDFPLQTDISYKIFIGSNGNYSAAMSKDRYTPQIIYSLYRTTEDGRIEVFVRVTQDASAWDTNR